MEYGLIGAKLGHSHSPQIHKALHGYDFELKELSEQELPDFLEKREFKGINVTIPYKKTVIPYCKELGERAKRIGSVNVLVVRPDGSLYGDNTDHYGMCWALDKAGIKLKGKHVLILGSGGTSLTARAVAEDKGAAKVTVVSRKGEVNYDNVYGLSDVGAVINTSPVGMYPNNGQSLLDLSRFPGLTGVMDAVYNPLRTALVMQAEALGIPACGGINMLVAQARLAGELFTGREIPDEQLEKVCKYIRDSVTNIVLIGMPGSGKSSVGRALAEKMGREFFDADALIEQRAGMSIPEIFERDGEAKFRELEHQVLDELGRGSGVIIATGGGAVCFERNLPYIRQNGWVCRLRRDVDALPTEGRPLSTSPERLKEMEAEREPFYSRAADASADNNGLLEDTVAGILKDFEGNSL